MVGILLLLFLCCSTWAWAEDQAQNLALDAVHHLTKELQATEEAVQQGVVSAHEVRRIRQDLIEAKICVAELADNRESKQSLLQELVAIRKEALEQATEYRQRGIASAAAVRDIQRTTIETKLRLAEFEGDRASVANLRQQIITLETETLTELQTLQKSGAVNPGVIARQKLKLAQLHASLKRDQSVVSGKPVEPSKDRPPANQPPVGNPKADQLSQDEQSVLDLVNAERKKHGAVALKANTKLMQAARGHATNMATKQTLSHELGGQLTTRLQQRQYTFSAAGENIAQGQRTPQEAMDSWMNSTGHRANILDTRYTEIGIGLGKSTQGEYYWTQIFGKP